MISRVLSTILVSLVLLSGLPAHAGDKRPQTLTLKNGHTLTGIVESSDKHGITLRLGPDSVREIPWIQLTPLAFFRARAALAKADDGNARIQLAELAAELGLYRDARREYEKALALGAINEGQFKKLLRAAETQAVTSGLAQAEKQAEEGDVEAALDRARELKLHFADAPNAAGVEQLIAKLLARVRELQKQNERDQAHLLRLKKSVKRKQEIMLRTLKATSLIRAGETLAREAKGKQKQGSITRARKAVDEADKKFTEARRHFGRLRRVLKHGSRERREILTKLEELDRKHFDLLYGAAWFMWQGRVYSHAERFAARASYIDPVHPDLVELRDLLISSRIRYRLSDMTNARPIVR